MPTCPTCRHVHAGPDRDFICIGCPCPHTGTCDCGHCETRAILLDPDAMAAIEEGLREVARGDTISLTEFRKITLTPGDPDAT
jgi:hypothetical protein